MKIQLLEKSHIRKNFACEEVSLTHYIRKQVNQDIRKRLSVCYVAVDNHQGVIGYYTLSSESLGRNSIPSQYLKKVPQNYNAPVILLGRLTRDIAYKGTGMGEHLLIDALFRCKDLSDNSIGAMAIVVDPINETAFKFYNKYGFIILPDSGKMFLPMKMINQLKRL